jgi:hypothetical protein
MQDAGCRMQDAGCRIKTATFLYNLYLYICLHGNAIFSLVSTAKNKTKKIGGEKKKWKTKKILKVFEMISELYRPSSALS